MNERFYPGYDRVKRRVSEGEPAVAKAPGGSEADRAAAMRCFQIVPRELDQRQAWKH